MLILRETAELLENREFEVGELLRFIGFNIFFRFRVRTPTHQILWRCVQCGGQRTKIIERYFFNVSVFITKHGRAGNTDFLSQIVCRKTKLLSTISDTSTSAHDNHLQEGILILRYHSSLKNATIK